jgi:hypothetical protein
VNPPRRWLLAVYLAAPLALGAVLVDASLLGRGLQQSLPATPLALPGYALVFGMPHIVASFFAFADPALARACAPVLRPALWRAGVAALAIAPFLGQPWADGAVIAATMVHVLGQQSGLALGQALGPCGLLATRRWGHAAQAWRWLMAAVGVLAAVAVGGEGWPGLVESPGIWLQAAGTALLLATPLAAALAWRARAAQGDVRALLALQATVTIGWGLALAGYPVLGIVLFRLVHDTSAFLFYASFANARERTAPGGNRLYRLLALRGRRPGWWLWPLASVLVLALASVLPAAVSLWLVFTHYLAEHRLWRHDSPLRVAA